MEQFEALRNMGPFTDAMFNHIVAFQEKLHPGWNQALPFHERIENLPLHALIFSNPDRDPAAYGPTVAPYYPLREEMATLAYLAKQVAADPVVLDAHPGNGFIGSLLAREGVRVIGVRDPAAKPYQIDNFYDASHYQMRETALHDVDFPVDVVFSSWMPSGKNLTPLIAKLAPRLIFFVHTDHIDVSSGLPQTGMPEAFTAWPENYKLIADWSVTRPEDVLKEIWPELTGNIEEVRHVKILADRPYHDVPPPAALDAVETYPWEKDLEMALLARQAKNFLRSQGFPV